ncbi:MAG: hypothetical protein KF861_12180 [Planctomycetaceae bacterium]|nr:hypothetical protein [Planctomycetaceae bacterium]
MIHDWKHLPADIEIGHVYAASGRLQAGIADRVYGGGAPISETLEATRVLVDAENWLLFHCDYPSPLQYGGIPGITWHGVARAVLESCAEADDIRRLIGIEEIPALEEGDERGAAFLRIALDMELRRACFRSGISLPTGKPKQERIRARVFADLQSGRLNLKEAGAQRRAAEHYGCHESYISKLVREFLDTCQKQPDLNSV